SVAVPRTPHQSPITLLAHNLDRPHQSVRGVAPVGLHRFLRRRGVAGVNRIDDVVVLGSGGRYGVQQQRDVHPDVALGLWLDGFVKRAQAGAGGGFGVKAMGILVQLLKLFGAEAFWWS